jgi:hypothetical protein
MKAYEGNGRINPRILDLDNKWKFVVSFTSQPLYPQRNGPWYPLYRRLCGPRAGLDTVVKRKIPSPCQVPNPPIIQSVAQRYTLSYMSFSSRSTLSSSKISTFFMQSYKMSCWSYHEFHLRCPQSFYITYKYPNFIVIWCTPHFHQYV